MDTMSPDTAPKLLRSAVSLWMDMTSAEFNIHMIPQYPVTGGSVTLNVTELTGKILSFIWYKGPNSSAEYQILTYFPTDPSTLLNGRLYFSRATPFPNGALLISDLCAADSDNYIVKIQTESPAEQGSVTLSVYERINKPNIKASTSLLKENEPFTLTCDANNATRIIWSRISARLPSRYILPADNRTITFTNVGRADSGEYRCEAENPASKNISDPYTVTVCYDPENVQITGQLQVYAGSVISLTCSADSVPPPIYRWRCNETYLDTTGNTLHIDRAFPENRGSYTCVANNSVTLRTVTASVYVSVSTEFSQTAPGAFVGPIIGIVISVLLSMAIVAVLAYLFLLHQLQKTNSRSYNLPL